MFTSKINSSLAVRRLFSTKYTCYSHLKSVLNSYHLLVTLMAFYGVPQKEFVAFEFHSPEPMNLIALVYFVKKVLEMFIKWTSFERTCTMSNTFDRSKRAFVSPFGRKYIVGAHGTHTENLLRFSANRMWILNFGFSW